MSHTLHSNNKNIYLNTNQVKLDLIDKFYIRFKSCLDFIKKDVLRDGIKYGIKYI